MKLARWAVITLAMVLSLVPCATAQVHRDPLTDKEADQIREATEEPNKRIHLLVLFTKARMEAVEHLRTDQNMINTQAEKIGELLDDVATLVDEIDDNLETFDKRGEDLRKGLREVIEANSDFQLKLRAIKESATPAQLKQFGFAVENATESVNSSADSARAMLDDQNAKKGKEKVDRDKEKKDAKKNDGVRIKEPKQRPDYTGMGGIGKPK